MNQKFLNEKSDCDWLRETHLNDKNLNNKNPIPDFQSFCLMGNEDCPDEILIYKNKSPMVNCWPARAILNYENMRYSFLRV